jgi:hypothetical protein
MLRLSAAFSMQLVILIHNAHAQLVAHENTADASMASMHPRSRTGAGEAHCENKPLLISNSCGRRARALKAAMRLAINETQSDI